MSFQWLKKSWLWFYLGISVFLFLARVILFVSQYGGVEHDSGWYIGVARNLAERGIYASYTNTLVEEGKGAFPSIHHRFSVQDENGFSYFPAGVTVGPGYIFPQAFIFKIFGFGWWQLRSWPLLAYGLLLGLLFYLIWFLGGFIALVLFQLWLWLYPQLTINFAFEAFGETIALFYLLSSFFLFYLSGIKKRKNSLVFLAGVFASLTILTKNLFALTLFAFAPIALAELVSQRQFKSWLKRWFLFALGLSLPFIAFEAYRYFSLTTQFGRVGYSAINEDIRLTWQSGGSGLGNFNFKNLDRLFILRKFLVWSDIGIYRFKWPFLFLTLSPLLLLPFTKEKRRPLLFLLFFASLISFVWFLLISPTGWGRHVWQGLVLGMMLLSLVVGRFLTATKAFWLTKAMALLMLGLLFWPAFSSPNTMASFKLTGGEIIRWRSISTQRLLPGFPVTPIFSLKDQKELQAFFLSHIEKKDRIYFHQGFLVAEASPLVDKVFYPLLRYQDSPGNQIGKASQDSPEGKAYLLFGPYQRGEWSIVGENYFPYQTRKFCAETVFNNPSYTLCRLRKGLSRSQVLD
jgi:hypothetical protein